MVWIGLDDIPMHLLHAATCLDNNAFTAMIADDHHKMHKYTWAAVTINTAAIVFLLFIKF